VGIGFNRDFPGKFAASAMPVAAGQGIRISTDPKTHSNGTGSRYGAYHAGRYVFTIMLDKAGDRQDKQRRGREYVIINSRHRKK